MGHQIFYCNICGGQIRSADLEVEAGILGVIQSPQDATLRKRTRELVHSLSSGCPECGFQEPVAILRKLTSLLDVTTRASAALARSAADRLLEQVALLKAHAQEIRS